MEDKKSKIAIITGGILGFLFGLHPASFFVFIVFGLCGVIYATISDGGIAFLGIYIICSIVSIIVGILHIYDGDGGGWFFILSVFLLPFNFLYAFIASIIFGLRFLPDLLSFLPLFPILLFPVIGYEIGKMVELRLSTEISGEPVFYPPTPLPKKTSLIFLSMQNVHIA